MHLRRAWIVLAALLIGAAPARDHWVGSWASSQQIPEPHNALPPAELDDATLRQVVRLSIGGARIRVLVSNAFGREALHISGVHVARAKAAGGAAIDADSGRMVSFDGKRDVIVPPGAGYWSDPLPWSTRPLELVAVTMHLPRTPAGQTSHPGSRTTSFVVSGNRIAEPDLPDARKVDHWFQLAGIAVATDAKARAIVTLGDSITDGRGSTTNGNDRWPDLLAERLQANAATRAVAVLNHGLGGNRLLDDGLGPGVLARFDRDVLAQPGLRYLILLAGVNDLGTLTLKGPVSRPRHDSEVARIIGAYRQIVARARAAGISVYGGTILPYGGSAYYHPDADNESDRQAVNDWVRAPGNFDAVIDFDAALRDPADPRRLRPEYDSGDGLHPSLAGYRAMAAAIPLELFK